jgi:ferritin-like metal-binding protein YciE
VFVKELMDISDAHAQFEQVLSQVGQTVHARGAEEVLSFLEQQTERAQRSLEMVLKEHDAAKRQTTCKPVRAMAQETTRGLRGSQASVELNLLAITNLQKILHYLIASLGSLCAWSELVKDQDAVLLFRHLTDDAKLADRELTRIAENELWSHRRAGDGDGHMRN